MHAANQLPIINLPCIVIGKMGQGRDEWGYGYGTVAADKGLDIRLELIIRHSFPWPEWL